MAGIMLSLTSITEHSLKIVQITVTALSSYVQVIIIIELYRNFSMLLFLLSMAMFCFPSWLFSSHCFLLMIVCLFGFFFVFLFFGLVVVVVAVFVVIIFIRGID